VHGDFYPGNCLWLTPPTHTWSESTSAVRLLDWEMCGIGSGPQYLGQYMLSNMEPKERRTHEGSLVQAYHAVLQKLGVAVSWDCVWEEYHVGGLERWLWFLVYFLGQAHNPNLAGWAQFFHDQMASFLHDHALTVDDITQVRP
jgi:hypothetical protein